MRGTGVAVWMGNTLATTKNYFFDGRENWYENAHVMASRIRFDLYETGQISFYVYELPAFMEKSGMMNRKQDITKLTIMAGMIHGLSSYFLPFTHIYPCPIMEWKGVTDKKLMNERTMKALNRNSYHFNPTKIAPKTTHEIDAIGIGLHMLGITQ